MPVRLAPITEAEPRVPNTEQRQWVRWSGPAVTVAVAAGIELFSNTLFRVPNPLPLFFTALVYSAISGGLRWGLISAGLILAYSLYFFSVPGHLFTYTPENLVRIGILIVTIPLITLMAGKLKNHETRAMAGIMASNRRLQAEIQERVSVEQALRESEERYRTLVASLPQRVVFKDRNLVFQSVNALYAGELGKRPEELVGKTDFDLHPKELAEKYRADDMRVMQSKQAESFEEVNAFNGKERYVEVTKAPVIGDAGEVMGVLVMFTDISARRKAEEEIKRLNAELEQRVDERTAQLQMANEKLQAEVAERKRLEQQKDEFISVASHELRTPLTTIKGYAQIARRTLGSHVDPQKLVRTLDIMISKSVQMERLISDMLDVTRIREQGLPLSCEPFDLSEHVRGVVEAMRLTAPDFDISLQVPPQPVIVNADAQRIEQVLTNLVSNAIKYTRNDGSGSSRLVEISVSAQEQEAVMCVQDHGVGIPSNQQAQAFGRFFRASNVASARYPYPGLGLGLYISREIIERHKGRMWLESQEGVGSAFYFALPLAHSDSPPAALASPASPETAPSSAQR